MSEIIEHKNGETNVDWKPLETAMHEVAQVLEREGTTKAIFGEPMKLDNHTVIPVATIELAFGGGGGVGGQNPIGRAIESAVAAAKKIFIPGGWGAGGGGGLSVRVRPVGFLSETAQGVAFSPIADAGLAAHGRR